MAVYCKDQIRESTGEEEGGAGMAQKTSHDQGEASAWRRISFPSIPLHRRASIKPPPRPRARLGSVLNFKERSPQVYLPDFMKEWEAEFSPSVEFDGLMRIFSENLDSVKSRQEQDTSASRAQDADIAFLIRHLLMSRVAEGEELDPIRLKRSMSGMRVLLTMLNKAADGENNTEKK
eukprot:1966903-Prymnesium_polylepis.1